jgi:c-di-AMP phosphodiesterase-like protein
LVKSTFDEIGLSFMYYDQQNGSADWLNTYVKQILRDQFIQKMELRKANKLHTITCDRKQQKQLQSITYKNVG